MKAVTFYTLYEMNTILKVVGLNITHIYITTYFTRTK